jgi:putative DNA primase/helicase
MTLRTRWRKAGSRESVRHTIKLFMGEHCRLDADGQVQRVAQRFALVAAAGELGIALGVLPWPRDEANRALARSFED